MRNRTRYDSRARADDAGREPRAGGTSTLLQRLLQKIGAPGEQQPAKAPAGQRSGSGAQSVEPYLEETRNTRPGPLE